jgi:hypothetical protein
MLYQVYPADPKTFEQITEEKAGAAKDIKVDK